MILKILKPTDKETVIAYIHKLPDKKFCIEIKRKREVRSISQNALYWLWLACIYNDTGNDKDYLHIYFGKKYLPQNSRTICGESVSITVSTSSLDTAQFSSYLERIQQFTNTELGIVLPNPEDLHFASFYDQYKDFI